jgi:hypothetical protein
VSDLFARCIYPLAPLPALLRNACRAAGTHDCTDKPPQKSQKTLALQEPMVWAPPPKYGDLLKVN